jgi:hypothetical protein
MIFHNYLGGREREGGSHGQSRNYPIGRGEKIGNLIQEIEIQTSVYPKNKVANDYATKLSQCTVFF